MSGAWSKGATQAVASAPPPGAMQTNAAGARGGGSGRTAGSAGAGGAGRSSSRGRGGGGGGRHSHNNTNSSSSSSNNNNGEGRGSGRAGGRGRGGGSGVVAASGRHGTPNANSNNTNNNNHHAGGGRKSGGRGAGGGRGGHRDGGGGAHQHTDRITIKDVELLEETGMGVTPQQKAVIRINAREFIRQRLQYVEPCTDFTPNPHCHWTDENRIAEIQALCSRVMELGDVSKANANKKQAKHETAPPLEDCKPLEVNEEKRWKSKAMVRKSTLVDETTVVPETTEEIVSKALLILNKVSWTTLDRLTVQFMETTNLVENEQVRKAIIELLVSKAQIEPHFGPMYAQICAIIAKQVKTFKKELLAQCQKEFEIDTAHKIENATQGITDPDDIEYHATIIRKAYIGHMKFLGELYLRDVVKLSIMMYCLDELLKDEEHEESLECFAHLMTTMGEKLDRHATQNNKNFNWQQVVDLRNSTKISNRIKFLLQDLLDLRDRGWVKRRKEETAKTIAELHKQVAKEEQEAKHASRRSSAAASLRRSTSLAAAPQVDDDGFVSITGGRGGPGGGFKKVNSKTNLGPPPSPSMPKPVSTSLRRAVSQPGMTKDVLESPFDRKKIASQLGAAPPMPIMEKTHSDVASPEHCAKKIQSILKEYYAGGDTDDAVLSVEELVQPDVDGAVERGAKVIEGATILAMEGIPGDVRKMLLVMTRSVQEGKIPTASIVQGWQDPLEFLPDIIIDAPLAGKHLALIIAECLKLNALQLNFLVDQSPEYFRTSGKAALLAIQVLMERGGDPSDEELEVIQSLMTDDDKKAFDSAKLMWEANKK